MIAYLLQVTICMAIFYGFYLIALQKETTFQTNRIYLVSTLLISLMLPFIKIYFEATTAIVSTTEPYFIGNYFDSLQTVVVPEDKAIPWMDYFNFFYIAGCLFMLVRFGTEIGKILNLNRAENRVNVSGYHCILSNKIQSPFSFFNTIYLPADHAFTNEELAEVLDHEHSHISGRHSIDVLLMEIVKVLLWISPMIYLYRLKLREVHEFLADAAVIKNSSWEKYAQFLVAQKYVGLQNQLSNQLIYSQLKNRLIMMTKKPSSMLAKWKYSGVLPLLLMALLLFSFRQKENMLASLSNITNETATVIGLDDNTEQPLFPGCEKVNEMEKADCSHNKLFEYVASHLKYPEDMKAKKVEGKVYVKFVITNNGYVAEARIQKSLSPSADKAALDVVNGMNDNVGKWTPGTKEGIPVTMEMVLPISFVLGANSGTTSDDNSNSNSDANSNTEVFSFVEEMPRFPGCEDLDPGSRGSCASEKMYKYIFENIIYPKEDRDSGRAGTIFAKFTVQADGTIANVSILRGVSPSMNAEVLRIINGMNTMPQRWIPGKKDGKAVAVEFTMPVKFVLQAEHAENVKSSSNPTDEIKPMGQTPVMNAAVPPTRQNDLTTSELHLSPNPASDHVSIELFEGAKTIFVFASEGIQITKIDLANSKDARYRLDVTKYPAGQYSVQVVSNTGSRSGVFTVIK